MRCRRRRERSLRDVAGDIRGRFATSHAILDVASRRRIGHERSHRDIEMRYRFATLTLQNKFSAQATKNKFGAVKHKLIFSTSHVGCNFAKPHLTSNSTSHMLLDILILQLFVCKCNCGFKMVRFSAKITVFTHFRYLLWKSFIGQEEIFAEKFTS